MFVFLRHHFHTAIVMGSSVGNPVRDSPAPVLLGAGAISGSGI